MRRRIIHYYALGADPFAPVTAYCGREVWLKDTTPRTDTPDCADCRRLLAEALAPLPLPLTSEI